MGKPKKTRKSFDATIERLADLLGFGHLLVSMSGASLLESATNEITTLRAALAEKEAEVGRLNGEIERAAKAQQVDLAIATNLTRRLEAMTLARDAEKARADAWQDEHFNQSHTLWQGNAPPDHAYRCRVKDGQPCNCPAALDAAAEDLSPLPEPSMDPDASES